MAPEVARWSNYNEAADVYSFSIVMWNVSTLKIPYITYNHRKWYRHVVQGKERPDLDSEMEISESMKKLMSKCWNDDIFSRPSFDHIEEELKMETCSW